MHDWNEAERHVDRALEMYERGRWAEAEAELRKALEIDPDQGDWHYNLGVTLERSGRCAEALASYEQASRLLPDALDARVSAGVACVQLGPLGGQRLERGGILNEPEIGLPGLARDERADLAFTLDDQSYGGGLHAAGAETAGDPLPQQG